MQRKLIENDFTLEDFRDQLRQIRKLGPLESLLEMMPKVGMMKELKNVKVDEKEITHVVAIIDSMTPRERDNHMIINGSRRRRIAKGSGTSVQEVNQLLKQYAQARKMMKSFSGGFLGKKLGKMKLPVVLEKRRQESEVQNVDDSTGAIWRQKEAVLPRGGDREGKSAGRPQPRSGGPLQSAKHSGGGGAEARADRALDEEWARRCPDTVERLVKNHPAPAPSRPPELRNCAIHDRVIANLATPFATVFLQPSIKMGLGGAGMKQLIEDIAKALVDIPEEVVVHVVEGEQVTVLELRGGPQRPG